MSNLFPQASSTYQSASSKDMAADSAPAVPVPRRLLMWLTLATNADTIWGVVFLIPLWAGGD